VPDYMVFYWWSEREFESWVFGILARRYPNQHILIYDHHGFLMEFNTSEINPEACKASPAA